MLPRIRLNRLAGWLNPDQFVLISRSCIRKICCVSWRPTTMPPGRVRPHSACFLPPLPRGTTVPLQMQRHLLGISLTMPEQRPSPARDTERADHPRRRPPSPSTIPLRSPAEPRTPAPDGVRKVSQQSVSLPGKLVGPFSRGQRGMGDARAGPRPPRTTRPRPPRRPQAWAGSASRTQH